MLDCPNTLEPLETEVLTLFLNGKSNNFVKPLKLKLKVCTDVILIVVFTMQ